jgi:hypothetical protein
MVASVATPQKWAKKKKKKPNHNTLLALTQITYF